MATASKKDAQYIAPDSYPQMISKQDADRALKTLRSAQTRVTAQVAVEGCVPPMRAAILQYVDELERVSGDMDAVFGLVHEIRGFAETAGLVTTGRIAEILCRYMDDLRRIDKPLDQTIVALHVAAITRAARAEDDGVAMGEIVAGELAALVARQLSEAAKS
jgi:hypothetical protein